MNFTYKFSAVKGVQANREYYIAMVPMKLLMKLFPVDDSEMVQPEYRAQRKINEARIPEIKKYILENRNTYVFSALSASIDGKFDFITNDTNKDIGVLEVNMDSIFLINDGQHRKAAIEAAILEDASIGNESISIVFFKDDGLQRSQQMFSDLNKHAVKTSNSLSTLYNSRDSLAVATRKIIDNNTFFLKYTDKEKDNLGKNSSNLFTLTNIYKSNQRILRTKICDENDEVFLQEFWSNITDNITEWSELMNRQLTKKDLRENYIITLGVVILAFGKLGAYLYDNPLINFNCLKALQNIDWLRSNKENWQSRTIRPDGKIMNNEEAITLTCSKIKQLIGLNLTKEELQKAKKLMERK